MNKIQEFAQNTIENNRKGGRNDAYFCDWLYDGRDRRCHDDVLLCHGGKCRPLSKCAKKDTSDAVCIKKALHQKCPVSIL